MPGGGDALGPAGGHPPGAGGHHADASQHHGFLSAGGACGQRHAGSVGECVESTQSDKVRRACEAVMTSTYPRRMAMISRGFLAIVALSMASVLASCASQAPDSFAPAPVSGTGPDAAAAGAPGPPDPDPWQRQIQLSNATLTVYQPQVESWQGHQLSFRAAVAAKASGANAETFGVVWGSARTEVDRVGRQVALQDLRLTRSNFPTLPDNGAAYLSELQQKFQGSARTIALDRIEASLAAGAPRAPRGGPQEDRPPPDLVRSNPAAPGPRDESPGRRPRPHSRVVGGAD